MGEVNPFKNQLVVEFFDELVCRVTEKLGIDKDTASSFVSNYQGDAYRHLVHYIDAMLGFFGNRPDFQLQANDTIIFLDSTKNKLEETGCIMTQTQMVILFKKVIDLCQDECLAWAYILKTAKEIGTNAINENHIDKAYTFLDWI